MSRLKVAIPMLFKDLLLTTLYTIPFFLALLMPGWRSLLALALTGLGLLILLIPMGGANIAVVLAMIFGLTGAFGLASGLITRAVSLRFASPWRQPWRFVAIVLVGYFAPPLASAALT